VLNNAFDLSKSIEELEGNYWPDDDIDDSSSNLERAIYALRKVPLYKLTANNLRILLGQNIGNDYTVPLVLELLRENPFIECEFYPGDLLVYAT
jgi:hypothetical protein